MFAYNREFLCPTWMEPKLCMGFVVPTDKTDLLSAGWSS